MGNIAFAELAALLGKEVEDPAVKKLLAKAGKVSIKPDFIVAKEAGFDFAINRPKGGKKKTLSTLFLFPEGGEKHRAFVGLPKPFAFGLARAKLLAAAGAPFSSWSIGKGKVNADAPDVTSDKWRIGGVALGAEYRDGVVRKLWATLPEEATGGRDLQTHPLHFETKPADAPPGAELVGMALLVAWAAEAHGLPAKHAGSAIAKRGMSPRTFLVEACGKTLSTLDFLPALGDFIWNYIHHVSDDEGARDKANTVIAKLLRIDADRLAYTDDFLGTFADLESPFYVPDSWDAVDRIAPVIAARLADYTATGFLTAPDVKLYEHAAKQRDAVKITPARAELARPELPNGFADELVGMIGRSLKDKAVKAFLTGAGLPVGKTIDQQANPALGVGYMGTKFDIAGKRELGIDAVYFYGKGYESYIRGLGAKIRFDAYAGSLPLGLALGMSRAELANKLGTPSRVTDKGDYWKPSADRTISAEVENDKLVMLRIAKT